MNAGVAPPGGGKLPAPREARHPLEVLQDEVDARYAADWEVYESAMSAIAGGRGQKLIQPLHGHLYTTDRAMDALAPMAWDSQGLGLILDDLVSWIKGMDAYRGGRGADRRCWLSAWSSTTISFKPSCV